jgi:hypothetical protein
MVVSKSSFTQGLLVAIVNVHGDWEVCLRGVISNSWPHGMPA